MEHLGDKADPQSIMMAVAFGGAVILGAMRLFSGFSSAPVKSNKKKKSRKNKKNKNLQKGNENQVKQEEKVDVKKEIPDIKERDEVKKDRKESLSSENDDEDVRDSLDESDQPAEKKNLDGGKVVKLNVPEEQKVVDETEKKKKKKRKKKNKSKATTEDLENDGAKVQNVQPVVGLEKRKESVQESENKTEKESSNGTISKDNEAAESDDGWETIPIKPKYNPKKNLSAAIANDKSGASAAKKKEKALKKIVDIGNFASLILGQNGSTVDNIEAVSGAKLDIKKELKQCVVVGDQTQISLAVEMINSLISNQTKAEIVLTSRLDKAIIGKNDTMTNIRDISGARVDFRFGNKEEPLTISIAGEIEAVNKAKELINGYLMGRTPDGNDGIKRMQVSSFQGKIIIGKNGDMVGKLQDLSKATINVEFNDDGANGTDPNFKDGNGKAVVSVIGTNEQITTGVEMIKRFLLEHNFSYSYSLPSDAKNVTQKLNKLRESIPNLKIDVNDARSTVLLTGSEEGINQGTQMLRELIDEEVGPPKLSPNEVMVTINLGSAAGKVVGKNRAMLKHLLSKVSNCKVDIKQNQDATCYVYGNVTSVKKVAADIEEIVMKHNEIISKSQQEERELKAADWTVVNADEEELLTKKFGVQMKGKESELVAPESDWGGFKLAQLQNW